MDFVENYFTEPSLFVKKKSFLDHGKIREIVTYVGKYGTEKYGYLLKGRHEEILEILNALPSATCSYAYKKGVKALDAVTPHLGNITFLKLDIKGFFNHIDVTLLKEKFEKAGCNIALDFCLYEGKVPIGFVTSPKLSDFYLYELDKSIEAYIKDHPGLKCSRYADDFLLSSPSENFDDVLSLGEFIKNELKKYHLDINDEKTIKAKLGKQTSVRFLGLNIGKDKITLSKWYILKTLNAFKRYHIARYNKNSDANLLKSIAFGMYNFIEQNSEPAKARFLKKYQNEFKKPFPKELKPAIEEGCITYLLDENGETYTAKIDIKDDAAKIESLYFKDNIDGAKVTSVINISYSDSFRKVKKIKLPRHLVICKLPFYALDSLEKNPIMDIVDINSLRPKKDIKEYINVEEVGFISPHMDAYDYDEDIYMIEKAQGGYIAKKIHNGSWSVVGDDHYKRESSHFVKSSVLADNLFYYLVEQVKNNKYVCSYGRKSYFVENGKMYRSPLISVKQLGAMQYFFDEIVKESTKIIRGNYKTTDDNNAIEFHHYRNSDDTLKVTLPFNQETKTQVSLDIDFAKHEKEYVYSHTLVDKSKEGKTSLETSNWVIKRDLRIKELLLDSLRELDSFNESSNFTFEYEGKKYSSNTIKRSLYHLLQFVSPIDFILSDDYLVDDGWGEYLYAGIGKKSIDPYEYQNNNSIRVVRISDTLTGREPSNRDIGVHDGSFKNCKNLEKVYIARDFYAYRNESRLFFGKDVFEGCDKLNGSIILYPSDDQNYVVIDDGKIKLQESIKIVIEKEEDLYELTQLPDHASIDVRCETSLYDKAKEIIENDKNIAKWCLGYIVKEKEAPIKPQKAQNDSISVNDIDLCDDDLPF